MNILEGVKYQELNKGQFIKGSSTDSSDGVGKFYVYRHIRADKNEVFYIGVGSRSESDLKNNIYKRARTKTGRNNMWKNIVRKTEYTIEILVESFDLELIKEKEKEFIKLYGRKILNTGTLCNILEGGDASFSDRSSGTRTPRIMSEEARARAREITKIQMTDPVLRQRIANTLRGRSLPEEVKKKLSIAGKGRKLTDKHNKALQESRQGEKNVAATLTNELVLEIKCLLRLGVLDKVLAKTYYTNPLLIYRIRTGLTWKSVEPSLDQELSDEILQLWGTLSPNPKRTRVNKPKQ